MSYPTATSARQYGDKLLTATYWIATDRTGKIIDAESYASIKLEEPGAKWPLIWSRSVTPAQATAALKIFEVTGITLQI